MAGASEPGPGRNRRPLTPFLRRKETGRGGKREGARLMKWLEIWMAFTLCGAWGKLRLFLL